ncbi:MAG: RNA-binding protein [Anaerolineaceae bacterium 4572_78]|nr:MAG: RNA-binding protein [Anaerolineaceae bacterium 4572_78]
MKNIKPIELGQFLKLNNLVSSGGEAKILIQGCEVKVNGMVETRRKKKLRLGDVVEIHGRHVVVDQENM